MHDVQSNDFLVNNEKVEYEVIGNSYNIQRLAIGIGLFILLIVLFFFMEYISIFLLIIFLIVFVISGILLILMGIEQIGIYLTNFRLVFLTTNKLGLFDQLDYDYKHMESIRVTSRLNINRISLVLGIVFVILFIIGIFEQFINIVILFFMLIGGILLIIGSFSGYTHMIMILMTSGAVVFIPTFSDSTHWEMSQRLIELSRSSYELENRLEDLIVGVERRQIGSKAGILGGQKTPIGGKKRVMEFKMFDEKEDFKGPYQPQAICPRCHFFVNYVKQYDDFYCYHCHEYVKPIFPSPEKKGKHEIKNEFDYIKNVEIVDVEAESKDIVEEYSSGEDNFVYEEDKFIEEDAWRFIPCLRCNSKIKVPIDEDKYPYRIECMNCGAKANIKRLPKEHLKKD